MSDDDKTTSDDEPKKTAPKTVTVTVAVTHDKYKRGDIVELPINADTKRRIEKNLFVKGAH